MSERNTITREYLRSILNYDPETGVFTWLPRPVRAGFERTDRAWNSRRAGTKAGTVNFQGYVAINIDGAPTLGHRLAWIYAHGECRGFISHIDGDRTNNRIGNLRPSDQSELSLANWAKRLETLSRKPKKVYDGAKREEITQHVVKGLLRYDPDAGVFSWRQRSSDMHMWNARNSGKPAGRINPKNGYIYVTVLYRAFTAQRLAFLYMRGEMPEFVDHINGDRADNRWSNLRPATASDNSANSVRAPGKSGHRGVFARSGRWYARIYKNNQMFPLGRFNTKEEAIAAYTAAAIEKFGEFYRAPDQTNCAGVGGVD